MAAKHEKALDALYITRRRNMRIVATDRGGHRALARAMKRTDSWATQIVGPNPTRKISEKCAREVESTLRLPPGWLDIDRG